MQNSIQIETVEHPPFNGSPVPPTRSISTAGAKIVIRSDGCDITGEHPNFHGTLRLTYKEVAELRHALEVVEEERTHNP